MQAFLAWPNSFPKDGILVAGFKAYSNATLFGPFSRRCTAVVGPNGVGKSVLGDAILFTLGSHAKALRVRSLVDVINHSLRDRKNGNAVAITQVVFSVASQTSQIDPVGQSKTTIYIRRSIGHSGRSQYSMAVIENPPGVELDAKSTLQVATTSVPLVCSRYCIIVQ